MKEKRIGMSYKAKSVPDPVQLSGAWQLQFPNAEKQG